MLLFPVVSPAPARVPVPVPLTARLVHVHEHQVVVRRQDGIKLLVPDGGELGHVPRLALVEGDVNAPRGALGKQSITIIILILHPPRRGRKGTPRRGDKDLFCHDGGKKKTSSQPEGINLGADDLEGFAKVGGFLQLQ